MSLENRGINKTKSKKQKSKKQNKKKKLTAHLLFHLEERPAFLKQVLFSGWCWLYFLFSVVVVVGVVRGGEGGGAFISLRKLCFFSKKFLSVNN